MPALELSKISMSFGGAQVLRDVSLEVAPAGVTGLIGPNGAGKTTLFNVISGLQHATRGEVYFGDRLLNGMSPHRRARIGIARTFQRLELFGTMTAAENVQVGLESAVKWWQWRHIRKTFPWTRRQGGHEIAPEHHGPGSLVVNTSERLLDGVGLEGEEHEQASALPTGHARMVELARALAIGPKLLLLDEPGSGLDEHESVAFGNLLTQLAAGGMSVLLVEHDMELVMRVCDQIHVLDFWQIIASGTPEEVRSDPAVQAAYLGAGGGPAADARVAAGGPIRIDNVHRKVEEVKEKLAVLHERVADLHENVARAVDTPPAAQPPTMGGAGS